MRKFVWLSVIVLIASGAAWGALRMRDDAPDVTAPMTAEVTRGAIRQTVLASGVIEAANLVSIGAQVSGQIQLLPVELGQVVRAGDLVAQIDPEDQQTDLLRAEAALAQIEAQILAQQASITEAELIQNRARQLNDKRLTATSELEAADAQLAVARANLKASEASRAQAELTVQSARIALERTRIIAPSGGTVVARVVREGQTINAAQSSPTLIKLADLETMVVKTEISEADVINVRPGQPASFTLPGTPDMQFRADLRAIEPAPSSIATADEIDTSSAIYYNALLDVPNPDGVLRVGMTAEVTIVLDEADGVLTVPTSALSTDGRGQRIVRVWMGDGGQVETRVVEVGLTTAHQAAILSGLNEGERVVLSGPAPSNGQRSGSGSGGPRRGQMPRLF